jgi:hypothetical protein
LELIRQKTRRGQIDQSTDPRAEDAKDDDIQVSPTPGGPVIGVNAAVNADEKAADDTDGHP